VFLSLSLCSAGDRTLFSASRRDNDEEDDLYVWNTEKLGAAFSDLPPPITPRHCLLVWFSHLTDITGHITQNTVILFCFLPSFRSAPRSKYKMAAQVRQWHQMTWHYGLISKTHPRDSRYSGNRPISTWIKKNCIPHLVPLCSKVTEALKCNFFISRKINAIYFCSIIFFDYYLEFWGDFIMLCNIYIKNH